MVTAVYNKTRYNKQQFFWCIYSGRSTVLNVNSNVEMHHGVTHAFVHGYSVLISFLLVLHTIELFNCGIKLKCTPLDTNMLPLLLHTRSRVTPSAQIFCHLKIQFANCHPRTLWVVYRGDLKLFTSPGPNICKCFLTAHASFLLNVYDYTTLFSLFWFNRNNMKMTQLLSGNLTYKKIGIKQSFQYA